MRITADTDLLVRALVADDARQTAAATAELAAAALGKAARPRMPDEPPAE